MLQIRVHHDADLAMRIGETGADRGFLAKVAAEPQPPNFGHLLSQTFQDLPSRIGRTVINDDDLQRKSGL